MSSIPISNTPLNETPILLGFVIRQKWSDGSVRVAVRWKRLVAACLALFVTAWLSVAAVLYLHFKYRMDFDTVSYMGMVTLPFRLDAHRKEMGNYHIQRGLLALEQKDYRDGFRLLRLGVARAPGNLEGRRVVAEFYELAIKRPDLAVEIMLKGFEYGGQNDLDFLKQTFSLLLRQEMDTKIIELAQDILPAEPKLSNINNIVAYAAANACHLRGNYDQADDYVNKYQLLNSLEGVLLSARISWDRGNQLAAIEKLEASLRKYPNSDPLMIQLTRYYRERGELDEARRYAILRNINNPLSYTPRIELLYIYNKSGDAEREEREVQRILELFSDDPQALQTLANFAAQTGQIDIARQAYESNLMNGFDVSNSALLLIEAHITGGDYTGALKFADELLKERPEWLASKAALFGSLRSIASFALDRPDLGEIYLKEFLEDGFNRPEVYIAVASRFQALNHPQQARKILLTAYEQAPKNQKLLTQLLKIELELGSTENLNKLLTEYLQTRRPQISLLQEAYNRLSSDRFIFTEGRDRLLIQLGAMLRENNRETLDWSS